MKAIRFTQSARKHRIGRAAVIEVITSVTPSVQPGGSREGLNVLRWFGPDARGRVLEVVGIDFPDRLLIIHVMPAIYRGEL